jgi:hypothetical protein
LSDHLDPNLTAGQIFARVVLSLGATAAVVFAAYAAIHWLIHFR